MTKLIEGKKKQWKHNQYDGIHESRKRKYWKCMINRKKTKW